MELTETFHYLGTKYGVGRWGGKIVSNNLKIFSKPVVERYRKLYKEEQSYLKLAIELAVQKTFGPNSKPYKDLYRKEKEQLARSFGLSPQTIANYVKGADEVRCYPSTLNMIAEYIGEVSWDEFLEKNRRSNQEAPESSKLSNTSLTIATLEPVGASTTEKVGETQAPNKPQSENIAREKSRKKALADRNIIMAIIILVALAVALFIISRKVSNATVDADLVLSAVTFTLDQPAEISKIQSRNYIRIDSATLYGAPFLDGTKSKLTANVRNADQLVSLEQFSIPADFKVNFESPIKDQLFIKLISNKSEEDTWVEGKISSYQNLVINKREVIPSDSIKSLTKAITFRTSLKKDESFEVAVVNPGDFEIPWMVVKEIAFLAKEKFYDTKPHSSIVKARIFFRETGDSIRLGDSENLNVTLTQPVRMKINPKADGLHVQFSGDVRQLSVGSGLPGTDNKNLMPRFYTTVIAAVPTLAWTGIATAISLLLMLLKAGKRIKKLKKLVMIALVLTGFSASAQIENVDRYRMNAIRIEIGKEKGSGFICAKTGDSVFVISAHHVVAGSKEPIRVTTYTGETYVGKIVFADPKFDLVMIGIHTKDYRWDPVPIATHVELGDQVFFITLSEAEKPLLPRGKIATIDKWDFDNGIQYVSTNAVIGGDSGSALLCKDGIAGMISTDQVLSVDILTIKGLILKWNKKKWQLTENP